jgi:hypothetical protein
VYSDHDFGRTDLQTIGTDSGLVESCVYGEDPRTPLGVLEVLTDVAKLRASGACSRSSERFVLRLAIGNSPIDGERSTWTCSRLPDK